MDLFTKLAQEHGLSPRSMAIIAAPDQPTLYSAIAKNGDSVQSVWLRMAVADLQPYVASIATTVSKVVLDALRSSTTLQRLVSSGVLTRNQSVQMLMELKRLNMLRRLVEALRPFVAEITATLVDISNHAFVAASTRIVEGLTMQIQTDDDIPDIPVQFDMTSADEMTPGTLTIEGMPVKTYLELTLAGLYTEAWIISLINRAFQSQPTFDRVMLMIDGVGESRANALLDKLKTAAFYVLHEASLRAAAQLSAIGVDYDHLPAG